MTLSPVSASSPMHGDTTRDGDFSVVIATRDRSELVNSLVAHLRSLPDAPDEIVVVDDASHDDTANRLRDGEPGAVVVHGTGDGPASARNLGAAHATGEWLVFLDDDDLPDERWIATFRELARGDPVADYLSCGFTRRFDGDAVAVGPAALGESFCGFTANYVAGTFAIRAALFAEVGGFTEGLRCLELTDLAMRVFDEMARTRRHAAMSSASTITIELRPPGERASQRADVIDAAWSTVYQRNEALFRRDRRFLADQHSTIAVAWIKAGDTRRARRHLLAAVRSSPRPRELARLCAASIRPLRHRVWPAASA